MGVTPKRPKRRLKANDIDRGSIEAQKYNDASGSDKVIVIEPVVVEPVTAAEAVGAGQYVKVTGTTYTLDLKNKVYDPTKTWQKGDVISFSTDVYLCVTDKVTGVFAPAKWKKVAPKTVGPVAIVAGSVVCTGRWHNCVTAIGFLIDDDSDISHQRVRD